MAKTKRITAAPPPPAPWERQTDESVVAFEAFVIYRDMGTERSHAKVCKKVGKNQTLIGRWSKQHDWVVRVEAWTDEQDRLTRDTLKKGVTSMLKKHVDLAAALQFKAIEGMKQLLAKDLSPSDVVKMLELSVKVERLSRGEVTEKTENKTEITGDFRANVCDLAALSEMELSQLYELADKIAPE